MSSRAFCDSAAMPDHHPAPLDLRHPFTNAMWRASGRSDAALEKAAVRRLVRGVYCATAIPVSPTVWARATLLAAPMASFVTHHTAAELLGVPVPRSPTLHAGTIKGHDCKLPGIRVHRYAAPPATVDRHGVSCTDAVQTYLDLAAVLDLVDLVVLGDGIVHRGLATLDELREGAAARRGRGARAAREAARLVRAAVESAMETRVRLLLIWAGLPEPTINLTVETRRSQARYRLDLAWPDLLVAVEYDGRHHIEREPQWQADLRRREELEAEGWRFVVLTSPDVFHTPGETVQRVVGALVAAGLPRPQLRDNWQRHFPGRSTSAA